MQVNHNVVAVVLNDVAPQLTFSVLEDTVKGGLGNKSKEFLIPNTVSSVLTRGPNTIWKSAQYSVSPSLQRAPETAF